MTKIKGKYAKQYQTAKKLVTRVTDEFRTAVLEYFDEMKKQEAFISDALEGLNVSILQIISNMVKTAEEIHRASNEYCAEKLRRDEN